MSSMPPTMVEQLVGPHPCPSPAWEKQLVGPHPCPSPAWEKRLSLVSSVLPWCFAFQDGVEDGEELSGSCGEGDHFGLAGCNEALVEEF